VKVGSAATASVNPHCDSLGVGQIRLGRHRIPIISHDANALCDAAKRWRKYRHSLRFCSLAAPRKLKMHNHPVLLRLTQKHASSHSAVDQDVECGLCSLPGGFQDLLPTKTLCRFRLRLHAGCIPLLQTVQ